MKQTSVCTFSYSPNGFHQLTLIQKVIDFNHFNLIIRKFNYQFELCKPRLVTKEQLKNKLIKISAAEMLTFFTYAPIMFGRLVTEDYRYWQLLIQMRPILSRCIHRTVWVFKA